MVLGKNKRLFTTEDLRTFISEMFNTFGYGCILLQEAKLFCMKKGLTIDEGLTILIIAEEMGLIKRGCDDLSVYCERLKRIGEYERQIEYLKRLGYSEEDGFVEVIAKNSDFELSQESESDLEELQ
ncbi:hypothetical protein B9Q11_01500 [Candidatus Marsarchaeota G2 archaeon ECH_B_SAG-F08]|uniref:Uncharacterized protein n=2 Tax=Candidatus Marsarchaeota group 2 TaxID=2203771 RepID=A0A2R6BKC1_9ARCH|nr:MAG: hypothetical protein B9Q11_01500 [Candidatus Marsarchaeota G2 archaeon ECH_B_SAG-F08]PSO03623.1 MAG: hypothetical protein B9Q10_00325 [Candidatus Marsarchaeota G2 archaeon ECH_B_SAG-E12]